MVHRAEVKTGNDARRAIRRGAWRGPTAPLAPGFVQANLVVLPAENAGDFEVFCGLNRQALPLLERLHSGDPSPAEVADDADLRTDVPRYRIYRSGVLVEEVDAPLTRWPKDACAFLLGCSFTFDALLTQAGIPVRHLDSGRNVPMYITDRRLRPRGSFGGPLVVSLRPVPGHHVDLAIRITAGLPYAHGAPIHVGESESLGIGDVLRPDFGDPPDVAPGDVLMFWACGVSAQQAAASANVRYAITHAPGHMFVTDLRIAEPGATALGDGQL